jgi:CDP-glucose 4,6-dehydratase
LEGVVMEPSFWRGRRVFITGHTGFKGGWLSLWLQQLGAKVTGFALPPSTNPSLFEVADIASGMTSVLGDIRELPRLRSALAEADAEIVFHLAAQPLVRASYADPIETYSTNVMGTLNVFEAVRSSPSIKAVINITSDKAYENREWVWGYRETDPMGGYDPYSSSKGCAELVTSAYRRSFGLPLASARAGNVIGGGDWSADRLVPDVLAALAVDRPVEIRHPSATRPWQHVLEPLRGYLTLAERLYQEPSAFAEGWNFGPDDESCQPVSAVVAECVEAWGGGASWRSQSGEHPHEAGFLKLDSSKARARLGWRPKLSLQQAIQATTDWHRAWLKGSDMRSFTLLQIENHG